MKHFVMILVVATALLTACQPTSTTSADASLNQEFILSLGREVSIKGEDFAVGFDSMLEDSRCPKSVQCVQAGQAVVALNARRPSSKDAPFRLTLSTASGQNQVSYQGYTIQLKLVSPYPEAPGQKIDPKDYEVRLVVSRS